MIRVLAVCKVARFIRFIEPQLEQRGIRFVQVCNSSEQASVAYKHTNPDVVIVDANWASRPKAITSVELIARLRAINPACKIIISTNMNEPDTAMRLKAFGINGYFYRSADNVIDVIVDCIRAVHSATMEVSE